MMCFKNNNNAILHLMLLLILMIGGESEKIHFRSCRIGKTIDEKLEFSNSSCDTCLSKSVGRVGRRCRFSGQPLLSLGEGQSPRENTQRFVDLVDDMMKASERGVQFTFKDLEDRLNAANIPMNKGFTKKDRKQFVLPKLSPAYMDNDPLRDPLRPKIFQCFSDNKQNKGNAKGSAALSGQAIDEKGVTAITWHKTDGVSKDFTDGDVTFPKSSDKNWECGVYSKARPAYLKWLQILSKANAVAATAKRSTSSKATTTPTSATATASKKTTAPSTKKKTKTKNAAAFSKPSGAAYTSILSSVDTTTATEKKPCSSRHIANIEFQLRRTYFRCNQSRERGPVLDQTGECQGKIAEEIKMFCKSGGNDDQHAFCKVDCFQECVDLFTEKAVSSFTPPILLM